MSKDVNVLLVLSLLGSAVLSLLVSLALVLVFVIRHKERKEPDTESFKARAVKESRDFGLLEPSVKPDEVRRTQKTNKLDKQLDMAFYGAGANAKDKMGAAEPANTAAAPTGTVTSAPLGSATAAALKSNQGARKPKKRTRDEMLKKHLEVTQWRDKQGNRNIGDNWGKLQRNPVPVLSTSVIESEETESDFVSTTTLNLEYDEDADKLIKKNRNSDDFDP